MNISTNTNNIHGTGIGFLRNGTARALLAMAITATDVLGAYKTALEHKG
jgi:hypothetical protein